MEEVTAKSIRKNLFVEKVVPSKIPYTFPSRDNGDTAPHTLNGGDFNLESHGTLYCISELSMILSSIWTVSFSYEWLDVDIKLRLGHCFETDRKRTSCLEELDKETTLVPCDTSSAMSSLAIPRVLIGLWMGCLFGGPNSKTHQLNRWEAGGVMEMETHKAPVQRALKSWERWSWWLQLFGLRNMEGKNVQLVAFTFMLVIVVAMGQQNCPPVTNFQNCLDFVHKDNKVPSYNSPCCNLIRSTSESCLCKTASSNIPGLDLDKALTLPKNCGRKVPDNTYCGSHKVPQ